MAEKTSTPTPTPTTPSPTPSVMELQHVNVPAAQTWNYLHINDVQLTVPTPPTGGKVYESVPRLFSAIETGIGEEAAAWIVDAAGDGHYIEVPPHTKRKDPIVISTAAGQIAHTAIMVRAGATVTIVVIAAGTTEQPATSAALTRIYAERDARVSLIELIAAGNNRQHLEGVGIKADAHATIDVRQYALGGKRVVAGIAVDLAGDASRLDLTMHYHAGGDDLLDINHLCRHRGRATLSDLQSSGVLADRAHKTLRETIDLVHGAKGARGNEAETVLVTGDESVNKTLPTILCDEDDVAGNHGATIGSISQEQIAYLADRGLSRDEAEALFVRALFDDAIITAPVDEARAAAVARAEAIFGADSTRDLVEGLDLSGKTEQER